MNLLKLIYYQIIKMIIISNYTSNSKYIILAQ